MTDFTATIIHEAQEDGSTAYCVRIREGNGQSLYLEATNALNAWRMAKAFVAAINENTNKTAATATATAKQGTA